VNEEFIELLDGLTAEQFWFYIATWKNEKELYEEMLNWSEDKKREEIKVLKVMKKMPIGLLKKSDRD